MWLRHKQNPKRWLCPFPCAPRLASFCQAHNCMSYRQVLAARTASSLFDSTRSWSSPYFCRNLSVTTLVSSNPILVVRFPRVTITTKNLIEDSLNKEITSLSNIRGSYSMFCSRDLKPLPSPVGRYWWTIWKLLWDDRYNFCIKNLCSRSYPVAINSNCFAQINSSSSSQFSHIFTRNFHLLTDMRF